MRKHPLWKTLLDRNYFNSKDEAVRWILTGKVLVDGQPVDKAGSPTTETADINIKEFDKKYVGKGGLKLEGALDDFAIEISGKVVLDAGASAGGVTDCLLKRGAKKVYAVDAGFGQLMGSLRLDPRVVNLEKTNISDVLAEQLDPVPDIATVDLSYLSLKKAIPINSPLLIKENEMICLVKPLFEVGDSEIRKSGRIDDPGIYRTVLSELAAFAESIGRVPAGITHSRVTGNKGTREFFLWTTSRQASQDGNRLKIMEQIDAAVRSAIALPNYK